MSATFFSQPRSWVATALLAACLPAAWAVTPADKAAIESAYKSDRAACQALSPTQDRTACLRDAGAHRDQALRQGLRSPSTQELERNALQRCKTQPPADQARCERMARGEGSVSGSVSGGGTIRELVTQEPPIAPMEPVSPQIQPLSPPVQPMSQPRPMPGG